MTPNTGCYVSILESGHKQQFGYTVWPQKTNLCTCLATSELKTYITRLTWGKKETDHRFLHSNNVFINRSKLNSLENKCSPKEDSWSPWRDTSGKQANLPFILIFLSLILTQARTPPTQISDICLWNSRPGGKQISTWLGHLEKNFAVTRFLW